MAVAPSIKTVKKVSAPKTSTKPASSHPTYLQMITDAIVALKERTGSSHYAIAKHIEEEQKIKDLPSNFKKILFNQLKKSVTSGKLIKVKNSFKLAPKTPSDKPKTVKKAAAAAPAAKVPKVAAKKKKTEKSKSLKVVKSPMKKKAVAGKAKKVKSIKSPVKKTAVKGKKVAAKK